MPVANGVNRYEAIIRIREALCASREPAESAKILANHLEEFLHFDHLDLAILSENSTTVEWSAYGKGAPLFLDLPVEELPSWHVCNAQTPIVIEDWERDERFPRLKQALVAKGVELRSVLRVPLTTRQRRLGTVGIASRTRVTYSSADVDFLSSIARVVASILNDAFTLKKAERVQAELQRKNERLGLLLNLTTTITSSLDLRDVLRAIAANIREVIHADGAAFSLPDVASEKYRIFAMDFPRGKGGIKEELLVTPSAAAKKAMDTMKPVVIDTRRREEVAPEAYDIVTEEGIKAICLIPLVNRGRLLGNLAISRTTETPFVSDDVDFLSQASGQIAIAIENALAYSEISELKDKLAQEKLYLEEEIRTDSGFERIIGTSAALKHILRLVETVAPSDSTVLLLGETGTGKELIARSIHDRSRREDRTFVKLNCAAIPTGLLESELFGHEKGAFTGAITQKIGRLELADQGTLFLDEVGDIPLEIQPKLLRVLQEREFERLGSTHTRKVNVRLVAATNRDLERMVGAREFRSDLFYRLNVFPIRIPSLRERKEDIPLLVSYFVQKFAKQMQKQIESVPSAVMKGLTAWEWPGNIRELENFIERAVILTRGKTLEVPLTELRKAEMEMATDTVDVKKKRTGRKASSSQLDSNPGADEYERKQREEIIQALTACKGHVGGADGAAIRLGINRTTLMYRMRKLGIYAKLYS
jgi:formate hydrogenlyase transcriptional activator